MRVPRAVVSVPYTYTNTVLCIHATVNCFYQQIHTMLMYPAYPDIAYMENHCFHTVCMISQYCTVQHSVEQTRVRMSCILTDGTAASHVWQCFLPSWFCSFDLNQQHKSDACKMLVILLSTPTRSTCLCNLPKTCLMTKGQPSEELRDT